jgi:transposase
MPHHRHQEFLCFLRRLDGAFPPELDLHLAVDNYGTHKHLKVENWLAKHRRFKLHFTPTSSSWLNLVERWFGKLTDKGIRQGTFFSVEESERAIQEYLGEISTATIEQILAKVKCCKAILETVR